MEESAKQVSEQLTKIKGCIDTCGSYNFLFGIHLKEGRRLICRLQGNKNARRPKEAHNAQNLKEIEIVDSAGENLKELDQH